MEFSPEHGAENGLHTNSTIISKRTVDCAARSGHIDGDLGVEGGLRTALEDNRLRVEVRLERVGLGL